MRLAFGLGSNMGEREALLDEAIAGLGALAGMDPRSVRRSTRYETPALLPQGAPDEWNRPFLNQAVTLDCSPAPDPLELLREVKAIEARLGRRQRGHWAPREIDIDILAMGDATHKCPVLQIPHALAHMRAFVLLPLSEIWPDCPLADGLSAMEWRIRQGFV